MERSRSTYAPAPGHRFEVGDAVRVKKHFPPGHRRTPAYIRGKTGTIDDHAGGFVKAVAAVAKKLVLLVDVPRVIGEELSHG